MSVKATIAFKAMLLSIFALFMSCETNRTESVSGEEMETPYQAHVAFAGGGRRAHSGHAGWTIALLDGHRTLDSAFANIKTLSSNSGGSWFNTMLTHSDSFVYDIQKPDAVSSWGDTGWLGLQQKHFDAAPCHLSSGQSFSLCVANYYTSDFLNPFEASNWTKVVDKLVYKDYPIQGNLDGRHLNWAKDKSLLLAASLLTNAVVVNEESAVHLYNKGYYQACLAPSQPITNGYSGAHCDPEGSPDVTPVTFSSMARTSGLKPPPFLPAAQAGTDHDAFRLRYSQNARYWPDTDTTSIRNPISDTTLSVLAAATASSAALGFAASERVTDTWKGSYTAMDESVSFQLAGGTVQTRDPKELLVDKLTELKMVRIADGGPVDNSGVAQLVSYLQHNKQDTGFHVIAFDNVQGVYPQDCSYPQVGIDIANLFGEGICPGNQFCLGDDCAGPCIDIPDLKIFETDDVKTPIATWHAVKRSAYPMQILSYRKYSVTTVGNPTYNITSGSTGTLHAFTCVWGNANTSPENNGKWFDQDTITNADFKAYNEMIQFMYSSMQGGGLRPHLEAAFGL